MFFSRRVFRQFIPLAVAVTLLCAIIYLGLQQLYRNNLNDPQLQISQDVEAALNGGADPKNIISPGNQVNMANSLSTFLIIYDKDKKPVASSGQLKDKVPAPPNDVFARVDQAKEARITWEPEKNVRIAAVIQKSNNNYVLVGRSMKEVENRIGIMGLQILIAWLATLILVFGSVLVMNQRTKKE
jgi:hypothetical protein